MTHTWQLERFPGFLAALKRWAGRFSPFVGTDQRHTLMLDITGCAHLFGGEAKMLENILAELSDHGLTACGAIADTKGAAWALTWFGAGGTVPVGKVRSAIADLPVAALRLSSETVESLRTLGITTIDPLMRMPRGTLARRFGIECMRRLDQATGAEPESLDPGMALPGFSVRITFPDPVGLKRDVMAGLERLLERLCVLLERHQVGARTLRLTVRKVDGQDQFVEISLAQPGRDPSRLRDLFERKVDELNAGFGIDSLRLRAMIVESLKPLQLAPGQRETFEQRQADLISRVGNRIGFENVQRFLPADSHIPEHGFIRSAAAYSPVTSWYGDSGSCRLAPDAAFLRPISLQKPVRVRALPDGDRISPRPPKRFFCDDQEWITVGAHGFERIAPEWWWVNENWSTGTRDYWQVSTLEGQRLWMFTTLTASTPAWYLHGVFA